MPNKRITRIIADSEIIREGEGHIFVEASTALLKSSLPAIFEKHVDCSDSDIINYLEINSLQSLSCSRDLSDESKSEILEYLAFIQRQEPKQYHHFHKLVLGRISNIMALGR